MHIVECGTAAGLITQIPIGEPRIHTDGNYEVCFGYFADADEIVAGKAMFAQMRLDQQGWQVLRLQGSASL